MKPYNNKVLVIDDKSMEIMGEIILPLQRMGFQVEIQPDPESGQELASHKYSVIFIDYQFGEFSKITGADICKNIRTKCFLSIIILITGFGKEHFEEFSSAPWDGCFEKRKLGLLASQLDEHLQVCLNNALEARYKGPNRLPDYFFSISEDSDLKSIKLYKELLDEIETVYQEKTVKREYSIEEVGKKIKSLRSRSSLSQRFQILEDSGLPTKRGLVIRHVLMEEKNLDRWKMVKSQFEPLKKIIDFYRI